VPIIEKRSGQVVSVTDTVSLMDNETLEIIEVAIPQDETIRSKLEPGTTVEYWKVMGRYMITHVRES
jgi:translation initiation factor 5A